MLLLSVRPRSMLSNTRTPMGRIARIRTTGFDCVVVTAKDGIFKPHSTIIGVPHPDLDVMTDRVLPENLQVLAKILWPRELARNARLQMHDDLSAQLESRGDQGEDLLRAVLELTAPLAAKMPGTKIFSHPILGELAKGLTEASRAARANDDVVQNRFPTASPTGGSGVPSADPRGSATYVDHRDPKEVARLLVDVILRAITAATLSVSYRCVRDGQTLNHDWLRAEFLVFAIKVAQRSLEPAYPEGSVRQEAITLLNDWGPRELGRSLRPDDRGAEAFASETRKLGRDRETVYGDCTAILPGGGGPSLLGALLEQLMEVGSIDTLPVSQIAATKIVKPIQDSVARLRR